MTDSDDLIEVADMLEAIVADAFPGPWGWTAGDEADFFGRSDSRTGQASSTIAGIYGDGRGTTAEWIVIMNPQAARFMIEWLRQAAFAFDLGGPGVQDINALAFARYLIAQRELREAPLPEMGTSC